MNSVQQLIDHAEQHCKAHGSRLTTKRKQVLSRLLESEKALSAYELIDIYKEKFGEALPAMSMYRILDFLQNERLAHKLSLANKYVACAHIPCDHDDTAVQFLVCKQCQSVKEISIDKSTIAELQKNVESAGFQLANPQLEMSCICDNCLASAT